MIARRLLSVALAIPMLVTAANVVHADQLIDEYNAYIGEADLFNSTGERLTQPWQIIRQDRANFYKYQVSKPGDESDQFFDSVANRAKAERMIRDGAMSPEARQLLLNGNCMINVKVWESPAGDYLQITVR
jgi:hypothetical protein